MEFPRLREADLCVIIDSVLHKYVVVDLPGIGRPYDEAKAYCETQVNTTLISIHGQDDLDEAMRLCQYGGGGKSCWVGLKGGEWEDESTVDADFGGRFDTGCVKLDVNKGYSMTGGDCNTNHAFLCYLARGIMRA